METGLPDDWDEQTIAPRVVGALGSTAVAELSRLAQDAARVLGTVPDDVFGLVIGEPLNDVRAAIAARYVTLLDNVLKRREVTDTQPVSPSIAVPMLLAAYAEARPVLQEMWAGLIAATMDSYRATHVRRGFIDTLQNLDPLDAAVLKARYMFPSTRWPVLMQRVARNCNASQDDVALSIHNLARLGCLTQDGFSAARKITPYGHGLIRACIA